MVDAAFDALAANRGEDEPIGLCLLVADRETMQRHPEAVWPDTQMLCAGHLPDGRQVRIRYFDGATIVRRPEGRVTGVDRFDANRVPAEQYRIGSMDELGIGPDDVLALWKREGAVVGEEAARRVGEVYLVASHPVDGLVGVPPPTCGPATSSGPTCGTSASSCPRDTAAGSSPPSCGTAPSTTSRPTSSREPTSAASVSCSRSRTRVSAVTTRWPCSSRVGLVYIGNTAGHHLRVRYFPGRGPLRRPSSTADRRSGSGDVYVGHGLVG